MAVKYNFKFGIIYKKKINSALCGIAPSQFFSSNLIEDLREIKSICKTILAHESGDPGVQLNEKTEGQKSRDAVPLIAIYHVIRIRLSW
jgi:hypothetical protein